MLNMAETIKVQKPKAFRRQLRIGRQPGHEAAGSDWFVGERGTTSGLRAGRRLPL